LTNEIKINQDDKIIKDFINILKSNTNTSKSWLSSSLLTQESIFVGFCGKLYGLIQYPVTTLYWDSKICQTFSNIETFKTHLYNTNKENFAAYNYIHKYRNISKFDNLNLFLKKFNEIDIGNEIFIKFNSPIFLFKNTNCPIIVNPKLSNYSFYNIKSSDQAFQELSMFIGGVLNRRESNMLNINDDKKLIKNGFDDQSFKTLSPGKKHIRRNK